MPVFNLICSVDGNNDTYSKALAGCLQAQEKFIEAFFYYQCTYLMNREKHQDCLFYSGVCLYDAQMKEKAQKYFSDFLGNPGSHTNLIAKAKLYTKLCT